MLYLPSEGILLKQVSLESEKRVKKLVLILATFTPVTKTRIEAVETGKMVEFDGANKNSKESEGKYPENLVQVLCIRYLINFGKKSVSVLFDLGSKVDVVYLAFVKELGLPIRLTSVKAQKIDGITLDIYRIVVAAFSIKGKTN